MDDYLEFVDDVRHIYLDDSRTGPAIDDMVSFLSSSSDFVWEENDFHVFTLCCLLFVFMSYCPEFA